MPRIPDSFLECVVYLYASQADSLKNTSASATGFLISMPSEAPNDVRFIYAVTNRHVIEDLNPEGDDIIVRINTLDGVADPISLLKKAWVYHWHGDDIAITTIGLSSQFHRYKVIRTDQFVTQQYIDEWMVGPGDGVIMVGKFQLYSGKTRNLPSVRFGNISMMPVEEIIDGRKEEYPFLVEMRSLSGYSGSPTFLYFDAAHLRPDGKSPPATQRGIEDGENKKLEWYVESNSSMVLVAPAWKIREMLDYELFKEHRKIQDDRITRENENLDGD